MHEKVDAILALKAALKTSTQDSDMPYILVIIVALMHTNLEGHH